jgi:hypothetical protein
MHDAKNTTNLHGAGASVSMECQLHMHMIDEIAKSYKKRWACEEIKSLQR